MVKMAAYAAAATGLVLSGVGVCVCSGVCGDIGGTPNSTPSAAAAASAGAAAAASSTTTSPAAVVSAIKAQGLACRDTGTTPVTCVPEPAAHIVSLRFTSRANPVVPHLRCCGFVRRPCSRVDGLAAVLRVYGLAAVLRVYMLRPCRRAICGDGGVGKTCIVYQYTAESYSDDYEPTIFEDHQVNFIVAYSCNPY